MITDMDMKKMKSIFVTKKDLKGSISELKELITSGFDRIEKIVTRTNDHDEIIENHERRLDKIEDKVFA